MRHFSICASLRYAEHNAFTFIMADTHIHIRSHTKTNRTEPNQNKTILLEHCTIVTLALAFALAAALASRVTFRWRCPGSQLIILSYEWRWTIESHYHHSKQSHLVCSFCTRKRITKAEKPDYGWCSAITIRSKNSWSMLCASHRTESWCNSSGMIHFIQKIGILHTVYGSLRFFCFLL